jgi:hypothetical protein
MAIVRQPSTDPTGTSYLRVLGDNFATNSFYSIVIHCTNGVSYSASIEGGTTGSYRTTVQTFTGLSSNTQYGFYVVSKTTSGASPVTSSTYYFTTSAPPPPPDTPPSVSINSWSGTGNVIQAGWSASDDKGIRSSNSYYAEISGANNSSYGNGRYTNSTSVVFSTDGSGSAFVQNAVYTVRVTAYDTIGQATATTRAVTFVDNPPTVSINTWSGASNITVGWTASDDIGIRSSNSYYTEISGANNTTYGHGTYTNGNSMVFTTDNNSNAFVNNSVYTVRVTAYDTRNQATATTRAVTFTKPVDNPPTVSINTWDGVNAITIAWTASDDNGIRSSNSYYAEISGANNTTYGNGLYTNGSSWTFSLDGTSSAFVVNSTYTARVTAYDNDTPSKATATTRAVKFTRSKPSTFNWDVAKVSGNSFNLSAVEWNNLLNKVNEFRQYRGLQNVSTFTYASSGGVFTADMFDQAINIINTMSPATSTPALKNKGDTIYASDINKLRDSLNSIPPLP